MHQNVTCLNNFSESLISLSKCAATILIFLNYVTQNLIQIYSKTHLIIQNLLREASSMLSNPSAARPVISLL